MKHRALISVYDKDGVLELASFLIQEGWEILSTGGTAAFLQQNGIAVTDVSAVTGFPECLDGRVKTLHPAIHAGLLAVRASDAHMAKIAELGIAPIDLVCVNLYPFFEKARENLPFGQTVEFIDIGGPTMLRSAAKNFQDVIVITDPADYAPVIESLKKGGAPFVMRRKLAAKVFNLTSAYDAAVSRFMFGSDSAEREKVDSAVFPPYFSRSYKKGFDLRYGENAHQKAALYFAADALGAMEGMKQIQGKELSYNNIRDLDVAWKAVSAYKKFFERESKGAASGGIFTVALKHNTPCGAARGKTALESYNKTFAADPVSIFGGIVGASGIVDEAAAEEMAKTFLEVIVAPAFTDGALKIFAAKKNLRVVTASVSADSGDMAESLSVAGGLLVQTRDDSLFEKWETVTKKSVPEEYVDDMKFGMMVSMFAKSNAILVMQDGAVAGAGAGQTNRIWAAVQALERAKAVTESAGKPPARILVSDAFFPFRDCVDAAAKFGITAIAQPGGSIRDKESIEACDEYGIAMVFTGTRHFKH
ncbi:MAG: bifunctional phosphoribosylaminoimidazolecarboxamide formyltransferase/IMP cyclohydrolase [Treponemataceae bacterium]|nr:MAG: bifunctional phosphoribosylaminoimidazolecarboxamide formyltransferase/IMP cyclohydrolase [Treponemataceae bacterium]